MKLQHTIFSILVASLILVGCQGGGGGGDDFVPPANVAVNGQMIVPVVPTANNGVVAQMRNPQILGLGSAAVVCDDIPPGYTALNNATVEAKDQGGTVLQTFNTDQCGKFSTSLPPSVVSLHTEAAGYKPLSADIKVFTDANQGKLVSLLPTGASYQISTLQFLGGNRLAVTVIDTVSRRAVIGLPQDVFGVAVNSVKQQVQAISSVAATNSEASVVLVMDTSSSMFRSVTTDLNRMDLASIAAHTFIEGKSTNDETGFVIFGSYVNRLTNDFLESSLPMQDSSGATIPWAFTTTGFVKASQPLHRAADAYNYGSAFYGSAFYGSSGIPLHAESGDVLTSSRYPFGGGTALWDATGDGIAMLGDASFNRRLVVAMTDGLDNRSRNSSLEDVITQAKQANVPVHTIGFGSESSVNVVDLTQLANETGGEFQRVEDEKLVDLYQNIQLGVRFQYTIETIAMKAGDVIVLDVILSGTDTASKSITIQ